MKESLIVCPRCESNACSEMTDSKVTIWICLGCGFTSNTTINDDNVNQMEETLPELYKALRYKDADGKYWYPNSVMLDNKSMVFAEGTTAEDWKWSAVQSKDDKADMSTKKEFVERDFMEALDYIGYFNQK
jgi:hypothetical protein